MQELLEQIREIVRESRQFGKSRLLREYLDEIGRKVDTELEIMERMNNEPSSDERDND